MLEMQPNTGNHNKKSLSKGKRISTRVDLTPMVDLGFLLITFFIFTTALAKPTAMKLIMPDDSVASDPSRAADGKTLTLLISKENRVYYYEGMFKDHVSEVDFKQLRNVIIDKKQQVLKKYGTSDVVILIKVTDETCFKNIVDSLDEMTINNISTFMLLDASPKELEFIK